MQPLDKYKSIVERDFKNQGLHIPDGFSITYNEETQLVKVFLDANSYNSLKEPDDLVISSWHDGKWEDKLSE